MKAKLLSIPSILLLALFAGGVHADMLYVYTLDGDPPGPPRPDQNDPTKNAQYRIVSSVGNLEGVVGSPTGTWNSAQATAYFDVLGSPTDEANYLGTLLGVSGLTPGAKTESPTYPIPLSAGTYTLDQDGWNAFFRLSEAANITIERQLTPSDPWTSSAENYSHVTSIVPIPAAVWLFGSALLGMVGIGTRRSQKS